MGTKHAAGKAALVLNELGATKQARAELCPCCARLVPTLAASFS
jgi:hypothetical protein